MLARLTIRNFTVFEEADFDFSPGLNVLVGTNGTGKSHVLKLGYSIESVLSELVRQNPVPNKANWQEGLAATLQKVFLVSIGRLSRRVQGTKRADIYAEFPAEVRSAISFNFSTTSSKEVKLDEIPKPGNTGATVYPPAPVFIPTKEVLSLYPGLRGLYEQREIALDRTYPDLCSRLDVPLTKGPRAKEFTELLSILETTLGGYVINESGHFYLRTSNGKFEIDLVAEGLRKLATVAYLLNNGSLHRAATLFWDEPEANLNPQLLRKLAQVLATLARQGFQIILATHSLFLLKELHILSREKEADKMPIRYFGLNKPADQPAAPVTVKAVDDFELLPDIVALDEELTQADALEVIFAAEDKQALLDAHAANR